MSGAAIANRKCMGSVLLRELAECRERRDGRLRHVVTWGRVPRGARRILQHAGQRMALCSRQCAQPRRDSDDSRFTCPRLTSDARWSILGSMKSARLAGIAMLVVWLAGAAAWQGKEKPAEICPW